MADELSMEDVISNVQDDMNDFASFEEATSGSDDLTEEMNKYDEADDELSFDQEPEEEEIKSESEEKGDEKVEASEEEGEKGEEASEEEIKKLIAKYGEEEVELAANALLKAKVDGEEVDVSVEELLQNYSGKTAWDKRFGELNTEKQAFRSEQASFSQEKDDLIGKVNHFVEAVNNSDADGAIHGLALLTGVNPVELREHFKGLMMGQVQQYMALTPEQQAQVDFQKQQEYNAKLSEYNQQTLSNQTEALEIEKSLMNFQRQHNIDDATLVSLYDELAAKSEDVIGIEQLEALHLSKQTSSKAQSLLNQVDPSISDEETISVVVDFMKQNPDMSDEEMIEAIREASQESSSVNQETEESQSKESALEKRVAKNSKGKKSKAKQESHEEDDDILLFDDIGY